VPLRAGRDSVVAEVRITDVGNGSRLVSAALLTATVLSKSTPIGNAAAAEGLCCSTWAPEAARV
jgi:hypothetical protein